MYCVALNTDCNKYNSYYNAQRTGNTKTIQEMPFTFTENSKCQRMKDNILFRYRGQDKQHDNISKKGNRNQKLSIQIKHVSTASTFQQSSLPPQSKYNNSVQEVTTDCTYLLHVITINCNKHRIPANTPWCPCCTVRSIRVWTY